MKHFLFFHNTKLFNGEVGETKENFRENEEKIFGICSLFWVEV